MTVCTIARLGEPILRRVAEAVTPEDRSSGRLAQWVTDLIETMRAVSGAGLAAPQVFVSKAVCVIEVRENRRYPFFPEIPLTVLVNPRLTPLTAGDRPEECITVYEGCLSVPGLRGRVSRPRAVRVQAEDAAGNSLDFVWEGVRAAVVQHEVDHLFGKLFVDRADSGTLMFYEEFERYVPVEARAVDGQIQDG